MDRLTSMAVFVRAVERGGFAAAADELGLSATMVGLHVRALEERLQARLLERTTRRQRLTEVGRLYYERCKQILADVEAADASANALSTTPRGTLRVTAPVSFGVHALAPAIARYLELYPDVEIVLAVNDRVVDLIDEGFEVAVRIGTLADSRLVARPLAPYRMVACASPDYLQRNGTPREPADLASHNCLGFDHWRNRSEWRFEGPRGSHTVGVRGSLRANNGEALRIAALSGIGIIVQPEVLLADDIRAGRLVALLRDYALPARPMQVVYLPDRRPTAKLRTFVDFVIERFGDRKRRKGSIVHRTKQA
jgi:DNA-binding transcriptional LysR family regulator